MLVEVRATGVCHTDAYTLSGRDSEGRFPSILGHEGAGVVVEVGPGVGSVAPGDHVIPLYTPECRQCKTCLSGKSNLCTAIRATQGQGLMPDGTSRFSLRGQPVFHYMGTSTFASHTVLPEIALARIRKDAPFEKVCYVGCGVTTGIGAVINTAQVEAGRALRGVRARRHRPQRDPGPAHRRRRPDRRRRHEPGQAPAGRALRHDPLREPGRGQGDLVPHLVALTDGGADYSFECIGNVKVMRQALECCHRGWGESIVIGVAGAGEEIATRPFQLVTGRVWRGSAFGGAGAAATFRASSTGTWTARSRSTRSSPTSCRSSASTRPSS